MPQQQLVKEERSLGDLFGELAAETGTLIRQEVSLAQAELTHKATRAGKNIGFLAVGGVVAHTAMLAVVGGIVLLLAQFVAAWLAAMIVGVVIGIAAYFLISSALAALKRTDPVPRETIETLKEDAEWLKKEIS